MMAAADTAYNSCWHWGHYTTHGNNDDETYESQQEFDAEVVLYDGIRRDLGIASVMQDGRPLPGSGWAVVEQRAAGGYPG
ncbi:MAG: hypothetical protein ACRDRY_19770 [Pseudonocardiaceae bacterium]